MGGNSGQIGGNEREEKIEEEGENPGRWRETGGEERQDERERQEKIHKKKTDRKNCDVTRGCAGKTRETGETGANLGESGENLGERKKPERMGDGQNPRWTKRNW
ncbi:hypothetical protein QAD02_023177 [Eretmocerus hayati]|uniref:Uncharacterized protein n=1 Tax=Eretmocerus hayati TaxID=131215 RepID=A0ACC2PV70_9HYME|nr:hypothetical protein QAD02_023177 [Eretmocerus hayati]